MSEAAVARRTPGPPHVRLTALSTFTLGLGIGFLGILTLREALSAPTAVHALTAAFGILLGVLPGGKLARREGFVPHRRLLPIVCGLVTGSGLLVLAHLGSTQWQDASLFLLGLAIGVGLRLTIGLLVAMLPLQHSRAALGLAGASFALGGCSAHLTTMVAIPLHTVDLLLVCCALVPALLVVTAHRAGDLQLGRSGVGADRLPHSPGARPRGALLSVSLLLQAAACGITACWLMVHLARGLGLTGTGGTWILALFWAVLAVGWSLANRMRSVCDSWRTLSVPLLLAVAGAVLLALVPWTLAAVSGAVLLGLSLGILHWLALRLALWPAALMRCRWMDYSLQLCLPVALVAGLPVGRLADAVGSEMIVWAILTCIGAAVAALFLLVVDYHISGDLAVV